MTTQQSEYEDRNFVRGVVVEVKSRRLPGARIGIYVRFAGETEFRLQSEQLDMLYGGTQDSILARETARLMGQSVLARIVNHAA